MASINKPDLATNKSFEFSSCFDDYVKHQSLLNVPKNESFLHKNKLKRLEDLKPSRIDKLRDSQEPKEAGNTLKVKEP